MRLAGPCRWSGQAPCSRNQETRGLPSLGSATAGFSQGQLIKNLTFASTPGPEPIILVKPSQLFFVEQAPSSRSLCIKAITFSNSKPSFSFSDRMFLVGYS